MNDDFKVKRIGTGLYAFPDGSAPFRFATITDKPGAFVWANRCVDAVNDVDRCDTCGSDASTERCCGTTHDDERPAGDH